MKDPRQSRKTLQKIRFLTKHFDPKGPMPQYALITLTPEEAGLIYRELNELNRPLSISYAKRLACKMKTNWYDSALETIHFTPNFNCVNGLHRCYAAHLIDREIIVLAVYGVDPEAFSVIDTGKSRTGRDVIYIHQQVTEDKITTTAERVFRDHRILRKTQAAPQRK